MRYSHIILFTALLIILLIFPIASHADVIGPKDTVTGIVIGRDRQPVPGAKVKIVGQSYSTFTDLDGRFNIKCDPGARKVLVSYPKAHDITKAIAPDMTVHIGRTWRDAPENYQWFLGGSIGVGFTNTYFDKYDYSTGIPNHLLSRDDYYTAPNISIMGGRVKKLGWYAKYMLSCPVKAESNSEHKAHSMAAIAGGMFRLWCPLHLYIGAGVGYTYLHQTPQHLYPHFSWQVEEGLMFRIKDNYGIDLSMNIGATKNADITFMSTWNLGFIYFFDK